MTKRYQPSILRCDHCGTEAFEEGLIGWLRVDREGISVSMADQFIEDRYFCSAQHAALYLIAYADRNEVLGHEAMALLGRAAGAE